MPPLSYIVAALVLAGLIALSIPATEGFSLIAWYFLFLAGASVLGVVGGLRIGLALGRPWLGAALVFPILFGPVRSVFLSWFLKSPATFMTFNVLSFVASAVALAAQLRLIAHFIGRRRVILFGYGVVAITAFLLLGVMAIQSGRFPLLREPLFALCLRTLDVIWLAAGLVITPAASLAICFGGGVEIWTAIAVIAYKLVASAEAWTAIFPRGLATLTPETVDIVVRPILALIASAAVWRMGAVLDARQKTGRETFKRADESDQPRSSL